MKNLIKSLIGVVGLVNAAGLDQTETNGIPPQSSQQKEQPILILS